ncbi:MAG: hypothetical protein AAFN77_11655 [Planctomycetota bacterium]
MITHYVKASPTTSMVDDSDNFMTQLLWGDPVHLEADWDSDSTWANVRVRGSIGWVRKNALRKATSSFKGLLEFYIIDVGQGDGVLVHTPDDKWHLIDAGVPNEKQMTKKGAANFLRWKFYEDLRMGKIELENLIMSHPDMDHYGGMLDLLGERLYDGRQFKVSVNNFYHGGMGRFYGTNPLGKTKSGTVAPLPNAAFGISRNDKFIVELLDDIDSFRTPARTFTTKFAELAALVADKCNSAARISQQDKFLPGYDDTQKVAIHLLGPIIEQFGTNIGLRKLGRGDRWESKTRNGHSVVLRFDYGDARILMTGDLNDESQRLLLSYFDKSEFAVDVAKGCHHGSDDVNMEFLKAMQPRATALSSGDNESYAHPRPAILGASAKYGRESESTRGKVLPPLVYSTELARSVALAYPSTVKLDPDFSGPQDERWYSAKTTLIKSKNTRYRPLKTTPIAIDLIYGLVNVRTDGKKILCATMKESGNSFDCRMFKAGVEVPTT